MVIYMNIAPGGGRPTPGVQFFQNHKYSVHFPITFKFFPSNDIIFVELFSLMLHAKFQNHRPSGSREEDF